LHIGITPLGGKISCWWSQPYGLPNVNYTLSNFKVVSIDNKYYLCAKASCSGYSGYATSFYTVKLDNTILINHKRIPIGKFVIPLGTLKKGQHTIYLQFWNDFYGYFGKPSITLKFKIPLKYKFEIPNLPFYTKRDILIKLCEYDIFSEESFLKSFNIHTSTIKLDENEYGILHINTRVPSGTTVCLVNSNKVYCQTISAGYGNEKITCTFLLPLLPGINTIYSKYNFRYRISKLKNCEPHSVRELEIRKSSLFYIKYDKPAIGIFKLKRPLYQSNASGCRSLAGGNIVTGWIAVTFPGSYCVVTGSGYRILPNIHPFNIIDVSQSVLYVEKEQYATVTCTLEKHTNSIYATFKSDKPCNFTAVAYFNGKPMKYYQVALTNSNRMTQTVVIPTSKEGNYCIAPKGQNPNATEWKIRLI